MLAEPARSRSRMAAAVRIGLCGTAPSKPMRGSDPPHRCRAASKPMPVGRRPGAARLWHGARQVEPAKSGRANHAWP